MLSWLIVCLAYARQSQADVFTYTSDRGTLYIVDDIERLPEEYREKEKERTKIKVYNYAVIVPVEIKYKNRSITIDLILDTGATITTITPEIADYLGINENDKTVGETTIADGSKVNHSKFIADEMSVGSKTRIKIPVAILGRKNKDNVNGLLGMNFLSNFPHMINIKSREIKWQ